MRRKILQDFANVFCQKFLDLPSGYDLATFVHLGSGAYSLNILSGACGREGIAIASLETCTKHREWLEAQLAQHNVPAGITNAHMEIQVLVSELSIKESCGHVFASARFTFACESAIQTDEKTYSARMSGTRVWGFEWYYEKLFGSPLRLLNRAERNTN